LRKGGKKRKSPLWGEEGKDNTYKRREEKNPGPLSELIAPLRCNRERRGGKGRRGAGKRRLSFSAISRRSPKKNGGGGVGDAAQSGCPKKRKKRGGGEIAMKKKKKKKKEEGNWLSLTNWGGERTKKGPPSRSLCKHLYRANPCARRKERKIKKKKGRKREEIQTHPPFPLLQLTGRSPRKERKKKEEDKADRTSSVLFLPLVHRGRKKKWRRGKKDSPAGLKSGPKGEQRRGESQKTASHRFLLSSLPPSQIASKEDTLGTKRKGRGEKKKKEEGGKRKKKNPADLTLVVHGYFSIPGITGEERRKRPWGRKKKGKDPPGPQPLACPPSLKSEVRGREKEKKKRGGKRRQGKKGKRRGENRPLQSDLSL